ncbi:MAG TPA: FtsX-like permease family protein [Stellaceae bacterium]|nr:FtsX-like permease family protein [Stellaceae bacterium]
MNVAGRIDDATPPGEPARRSQSRSFFALTLARRELRGGLGGFRVFLACLVLGVGAIAAIGSLEAAVEAGIRRDARALLGGDVSARLPLRPASDAERRFLSAGGRVSETVNMRAMARAASGRKTSLIALRAVDRAYPLYGSLTLAPAQRLGAALAEKDGVFGAVAEAALARRLGLAVGGEFLVGDARLRLAAIIAREPDAALGGLAFGPRVIVAQAALPATRLVQPGALVDYVYRLRLPPGSDAAGWIAAANMRFPHAGWQLRSTADAAPSLQRLIDRLGFLLGLAAITALLVGGVGVANAVTGYITSKRDTIATLKCLGAEARLVFAAYFIQILLLALAGIAVGTALGAIAPAAIAPPLRGLLPLPLSPGVYPSPLATAALCGLLITLLFAAWPLAAIGRITPGALWRDRIAPQPRSLAPIALATGFAAGVALAGLVVLTAPNRRVALWYVGGALASFALFRLAGALVVAAARALPHPSRPLLRLAVANLHRPGAPTARIVLSLGIGLSVMIAVALVEGNLTTEIEGRLAAGAPADFVLDLQPAQMAAFAAIVRAAPDASFDQVPMLRGRIVRLNGTPVERAKIAPDAEWAVRGERGLTYAAHVPQGSRLVAGRWWPADYSGPPLVSFDDGLARGMGLKVGDTLTVNLLGRDITARIANLRHIDWTRLGINFAMVFAPGTLEAAPQTRLAALYAPPGTADRIVEEAARRLPNVSAIPVRDALAEVARLVAAIGGAVRVVSLATVVAGILVLGGAVAASHRERINDAVVLKVLGATRGMIAAGFVIEYLLLGLAAAAVAAAVGTLAAWALVTGPMKMAWTFLPGPLLLTAAGAVALTLALGLAGTWHALGAKPARYLRQE